MGYGISLQRVDADSLHPIFISNNMVYLRVWSNLYYSNGIILNYSGYSLVYYNTSAVTSGMYANSPAFATLNRTDFADIKNNVFVNDNINPVAVDTSAGYITAYNAYWSGRHIYSSYPSNTDPGIVLVYPDFISTTDLHLNQHTITNDSVIGKGIPINGITTDIDGNLRDPLHPTIGADEYDSLVFVGIPPTARNNDYAVFPNPAGAFVFVQSGVNADDAALFELYDLSGRLISTTVLDNSLVMVKTNELSAGFYLYRIVSGGQVVKSGKLVRAGE